MSSASTREMRTGMSIRILVLALLLAGVCCPPAWAVPAQDTTKSVIVSFRYLDGTVIPEGSRVIYGHPPDNIANRDLIAEMTAKDSTVLRSCGIEDPRVLYLETGAIMEKDVRFAVIMPFASGGNRVSLTDGRTNRLLATADISNTVAEFCSAHPGDPDCGGGGPPLLLYGAAVLAILVIAIAGAWGILQRKKTGRS